MIEGFLVSSHRGRRFGTCAWCGRRDQKLTMTVHRTTNDYRQADVCEACLNKNRDEWRICYGKLDQR